MNASRALAVLYQATAAPEIDGILKPMKPGGYIDSSADIAFTLREAGEPIVTPTIFFNAANDLDWSFPDTIDGITDALDKGAECLWANTVLYVGHPIGLNYGRPFAIVGQKPGCVQRFDNKFVANETLRNVGLTVARSVLCEISNVSEHEQPVATLMVNALHELDLGFPLVAKPVRGRGSEGVAVVCDLVA